MERKIAAILILSATALSRTSPLLGQVKATSPIVIRSAGILNPAPAIRLSLPQAEISNLGLPPTVSAENPFAAIGADAPLTGAAAAAKIAADYASNPAVMAIANSDPQKASAQESALNAAYDKGLAAASASDSQAGNTSAVEVRLKASSGKTASGKISDSADRKINAATSSAGPSRGGKKSSGAVGLALMAIYALFPALIASRIMAEMQNPFGIPLALAALGALCGFFGGLLLMELIQVLKKRTGPDDRLLGRLMLAGASIGFISFPLLEALGVLGGVLPVLLVLAILSMIAIPILSSRKSSPKPPL